MNVKKICFVALYTYPLFNPKVKDVFGGSEVRAWLFGAGLSRFPENEVSFVVFDHQQPRIERHGQVMVYPHSFYKAQSSQKGKLLHEATESVGQGLYSYLIRAHLNRTSVLLKNALAKGLDIGRDCVNAMRPSSEDPILIDQDRVRPEKVSIYKDIDAEVYCTFGVSNFSAELMAYCKHHHKKSILFVGHDLDLSDQYYEESGETNEFGNIGSLCYYALMQADLIITQTDYQAKLLKGKFGRDSLTLYNPVNLAPSASFRQVSMGGQRSALWIGKSNYVKRPEILLKLARACGEVHFIMVLNCSNTEIFDHIVQNKPKNIQILEWVPFQETEDLLSQAFVLINTSTLEGFPNTFLQAGKYGVPLLSFQVDPDGFIEKHKSGLVAHGDFGQLVNGLKRFCSERAFYEACSRNVRRYVSTYHDATTQVNQLNQIMKDFVKG